MASPEAPPSLDQQLRWLYDEQDRREKQAVADQGRRYVDNGGWITVAYEVLDTAPEWVSAKARSEYTRCNGLPPRR